MIKVKELEDFVTESNKIEGIVRDSTDEEIVALDNFLNLDRLTVSDLVEFVSVYEPVARLRLNGELVQIGDYMPPAGGQAILYHLEACLFAANNGKLTPYSAHVEYEKLHPFTDCNGRSGRALWLWMMVRDGRGVSLGFLHTFYYQTLGAEQE